MALEIIDISPSEPEQLFNITLDGLAYNCRVYFNDYDDQIKDCVDDNRNGKWYLDLLSSNGEISILGIALVSGCDLLEPYGVAQIGSMMVFDLEGVEDPTYSDWGSRFELRYIPIADAESFLTSIGYLYATI